VGQDAEREGQGEEEEVDEGDDERRRVDGERKR
jgi:hypothetical protein